MLIDKLEEEPLAQSYLILTPHSSTRHPKSIYIASNIGLSTINKNADGEMLGLNITVSRSQVATYFLCVCLFSISFLVFLNSLVSFVITERIGQKHNVGDAVGTLGFADELLALVACPLWGALSDHVGVRTVVV